MKNDINRTVIKSICLVVFILVALVPTLGCMLGMGVSRVPQSHFAYPNSNVYPLGHTTGSDKDLCGLFGINWGAPDGDDLEEAVQEALRKKGGDLLINMRVDAKLFTMFIFSICITNVQGTAARMEVGKQRLDGVGTPPRKQPRRRAFTPATTHGNTVQEKKVWFYAVGNNKLGPVSRAWLINLYRTGRITPVTLVWRQGLKVWSPINRVLEFSSIFQR